MLFKSQTLAKQTEENSGQGMKDVYRKSWVDKVRKALFFVFVSAKNKSFASTCYGKLIAEDCNKIR